MNRLTPNLWAYSAFASTTDGVESRELDFNLARRSGLIINRIIGQAFIQTNTTSGHGVAGIIINELDVDPDNTEVEFSGATAPDSAVLDSSRVFRQVAHVERDTAAGVENSYHTVLQKDWSAEVEIKRPISITPLRHHFRYGFEIASFGRAEIAIDYFIVELTLEELGIINASRR